MANFKKIVLKIINNSREKFSPGPGFEPGSPALRAGAITIKLENWSHEIKYPN